jgi:acetyl-CoA carboxylase carboxyltransferase component
MAAYRMHFLSSGRISGRQDFEADGDVAAIRIARVLYDTCSDICQSFELWQGKRQIRAQQPHHSRASLTDLIEAHQRVTIDTEEVISQSDWMIARSRRLIETLDRIKSKTRPTSSNREAPA